MFDCGINKIIGDMVSSIEEENEEMIYKAVQNVGIDVDKKQLEKALFNAKSFYNDGYEDAKKKYERKWTPVSKELPKVADCYLVTRDDGDDLMVSACYFDGIHTWHDDNWINDERNYLTDIIAWMPLPEEYKPEGYEGE